MHPNDQEIQRVLSEKFAHAELPVSPSVWAGVSSSAAVKGGIGLMAKALIGLAIAGAAAVTVFLVAYNQPVEKSTEQTHVEVPEPQIAAPAQPEVPVEENVLDEDTAPTSVSAMPQTTPAEPAVEQSAQSSDTASFAEDTSNSNKNAASESTGNEAQDPAPADKEEVKNEHLAVSAAFTVFNAIDPLEIICIPDFKNADSYLWKFGDGEVSTEKNPVHRYSDSGEYDVELTVTHGDASFEDAQGVSLYPDPVIEIPNTFSPNGDGVNDVISVAAFAKNISSGEMVVYSTRGEIVYRGDIWRGVDMSGMPLESGRYTLIVQVQSLTGEIVSDRQIVYLQR
ncbi:MAG: hypothetical protein RL226_996 [Bacteroidota bacterium]|jgi:hypothetical protein